MGASEVIKNLEKACSSAVAKAEMPKSRGLKNKSRLMLTVSSLDALSKPGATKDTS